MIAIRRATPDDAEQVHAMLLAMLKEPIVNIPLAPDELRTLDEQRTSMVDLASSERAALFVAVEGKAIAGELTIQPISTRRALLHVATLGITVAREWRGRGVGSALIAAGLEFARTAGYKRVELVVYARNTAAIGLYEKHGFVREGVRRGLIREGDSYLDDILMARVD